MKLNQELAKFDQELGKIFEGSTNTKDSSSGDTTWTGLRQTLEKYGLLTIEQHSHQKEAPFLRFHPALLSFSRHIITQEQYEYLMKKYREGILLVISEIVWISIILTHH